MSVCPINQQFTHYCALIYAHLNSWGRLKHGLDHSLNSNHFLNLPLYLDLKGAGQLEVRILSYVPEDWPDQGMEDEGFAVLSEEDSSYFRNMIFGLVVSKHPSSPMVLSLNLCMTVKPDMFVT